MAQLNYSDLGLVKKNDITVFKYGTHNIEVKKYLSVADKYDIVMITLQESAEDGYYNPIKIDMFYHLNLVYMYTNLIFTEEERSNPEKLYDELKTSGFLESFIQHIDKNDYDTMRIYVDSIAALSQRAQSSTAYIVKKLIDDLPANAEAAQSIVDNFDPEKYQAVVDFAKAANGGRSLPK